MSLTIAQSLRNLALGQAMMVAPALGESYEGKTAGTIAALLLMLADDAETRSENDRKTRAEIGAMLARSGGAATASDSLDELMGRLGELHDWADENDPPLARECRQFLLHWAERERLRPPALPG